MKKFLEPQIEVVTFAVEDVITSSTPTEESGGMTFIGDCL